jgi:hypothetical protein
MPPHTRSKQPPPRSKDLQKSQATTRKRQASNVDETASKRPKTHADNEIDTGNEEEGAKRGKDKKKGNKKRQARYVHTHMILLRHYTNIYLSITGKPLPIRQKRR